MPDPSPQLIDTVAAAIADMLAAHGTGQPSQPPHSWRCELPEMIYGPCTCTAELVADIARATLAATPKPIGYVGAWHEGDRWTLDIEYGEYLRPTAAQALKVSGDYHYPIHAVVAVVPVEGNPA